MPTKTEIVQLYLDAQRTNDASAIEQIANHLADDVVMSSPRGNLEGKDAIVDRLKNPPYGGGGGGGMMGMVQWGEPAETDEGAVVEATLPPNPMGMTGMSLAFTFSGDETVSRIQMTPKQG